MSKEWYNSVAVRNNGYKSDARFVREGLSGEVEFEKMITSLIPHNDMVLDIGCGHGEFTIKMARFANQIIAGDNAEEMIKIARKLLEDSGCKNIEFHNLWTHEDFPFADETFDLIYSRRGPTSILDQARILKRGSRIVAIHSESLNFDKIRGKMEKFGFDDLQIEEFNDCYIYFETIDEMGKFLAASHGNPDYTLPEHRAELERIAEDNMKDGRYSIKEFRYIWSVRRKL